MRSDAYTSRPAVRGKFLWAGGEKLFVRGVAYGTFRPREDGVELPSPERVEADLAEMAAAGFNTVRTYTVPPRELLDAAARHGLRVMAGIPWEQHITFLDDRGRAADIERRVRAGVRACAGDPAILCYAIGNEIPASIVRWHGRRKVTAFLERLYRAAKEEDPGGLVTYVNFPTTEYLELPFLDLCAFNVYLEQEERLEAYLARLQVLAGDRPLVMAEIGLDSRRNGEWAQADSLQWQLRSAFRAGCAGATVFAWTDEWHRGGHDVDDWDFGLVTREREPKPALAAVARTLADLPLPRTGTWPRMSVVVCTYNGARTLGEALAGATRQDYPDYEVIVVDDGSTDDVPAIAAAHGVRCISTPNRGLSAARTTGAQAATGEIVCFLDDDAVPDPDWLTYLALAYRASDHVAIGGPNVPPPEAQGVAACIAAAPGGPIHVLLSDTVAEHIPGCNLSVRRDALLAVGGFDPRFRVAGDDVDFCWRLRDRGWTIGFSPAAMVVHRRRETVRAYWRQQRAYGRAEALLERKWPDRYNGAGHLHWAGRIYAPGGRRLLERWRVYGGTWGSGFFQRLYAPAPSALAALPLMPEWLLVVAFLALLTAGAALWPPLLAAAPLLVLALGATLAEAWSGAKRPRRAVTAALFVVQAAARLTGRIEEGLAPWARRARPAAALPRRRRIAVWCETWAPAEARLEGVERRIRASGARTRRGGDFDRWDLEVRGGTLAGTRLLMAVEEHGAERQLLRFRLRPRPAGGWLAIAGALAALAGGAAAMGASMAAALLATPAVLLAVGMFLQASWAVAAAERALVEPVVPVPEVVPVRAAQRAPEQHALTELLGG